MRLLLDTHTVLWAAIAPEFLSRKAARTISDPVNTILVSAASAWEIATKVRIGKLPGAEAFEKEFIERTELAGYVHLPLDVPTALRAGRLAGDHRDPFDRMIAAQAISEDIPIISKDPKLDAFGIRRLW